ncbi:MAG: sulfatase/phosphatase domain-containing protein, partial [Pseudomonadota bacterium]
TVRADIARQYDNLSFAEEQLATLLQDLKTDGLEAETLVIVTTDHGDGLPRMKRSLYDSGLQVPMLVRFPDRRGAGQVDDRLVSFVDLAPTMLSYAEQPVPSFVQGQVVFGTDSAARRSYVYAAMDRHDEVPDRLRAARDERYKYIRNFKPQAPFFRPLSFRDQMPTMQAIWRAHAAGTAPPALAALLSPNRPAEELYDLQTDPHEVINLAKDPQHHETLIRLRAAYDAFAARAGDASEQPEAKMIARMWPGMEQPVTAAPVVDVRAGRVHLTSPTPGAAIGYRFSGQQNWRVYTQPLVLAEESPGQESTVLEAQAERYGYERSAVVSVPF